MSSILKITKSMIVLIVFIVLMTIVSGVIYIEYNKTKENVFSILEQHLLDEKVQLFKKYSQQLLSRSGKDLKYTLQTNKLLCKEYENSLSVLQGDEIKYLYLLYKDSESKLRYLLDATTNTEEKAEFNQKFDPQTDIWMKAYSTKKVQIIQQKESDLLWTTVAFPILKNDKVIAVLGADFTYDVYQKIINTLKPLEKVYYYIGLFMIIMLFLAYLLILMYYKSRKKAFIDPLTKVYNRQYLSEFLEFNSLKHYSLMMIDLDHFKQVNDNFGHDAGDEVLRSVVQEIKMNIRKEDVLVRFGGEEFLLLVYKKNIQDPTLVAQRIRIAIMNRIINARNSQINITISIGVNPVPYYAKNIEEAIKIADEQLYLAKSSGRNRIEIFHELDAKQSQGSKRISDIQLAIDEQRMKCAFQPIYTNELNKLTKYELLIRLKDTNGDIITPMNFLPYIKHTQVYINLTRYIVNVAWETLNNNSFELSLNLDLQDILNEDIIGLFREKFEQRQDLAKRLTIEILEHEQIDDFDLIKQRLEIFKNLGFKIAIDDFGSGYANFKYLMNLDIDILKIDGSIIKDIDKQKAAYNIVQTIIVFAQSMGMQTVAEQVETQEEYETLKKLEIDFIQGYYLGKPSFSFVDETTSLK